MISLDDCRAHLALTGKPAEKWRSLEVFHAQFHGGVGPRGVELLFDERRFVLALLRRQGLPQAEEQPAVAGVFVNRRTEDSFRLLSLSVAQQRGGQRLPRRVEPRWRLIVLERRLTLDRTAPPLNGLFLFPARPSELRVERGRGQGQHVRGRVIEQIPQLYRHGGPSRFKLRLLRRRFVQLTLPGQRHGSCKLPERAQQLPLLPWLRC